ncbi:uncharacterized protein LOC144009440 isoform X2 [Festucalex cinctus]
MCATSNDEGGLGRTRSQQTQDLRTWLDLRFKLLLGRKPAMFLGAWGRTNIGRQRRSSQSRQAYLESRHLQADGINAAPREESLPGEVDATAATGAGSW